MLTFGLKAHCHGVLRRDVRRKMPLRHDDCHSAVSKHEFQSLLRIIRIERQIAPAGFEDA